MLYWLDLVHDTCIVIFNFNTVVSDFLIMKPAKEADCHVKVLRTSEIDDILFPSHEGVELDEFNFIDDNDELTKKGF